VSETLHVIVSTRRTAALHWITLSACSASLNPARDLGPRLVMVLFRWGLVALTDMWPYIIGPMIGGPVGAFCADKILLWV
jgi:glycerol uptake facilitator-like aquaporin